MALLTVSVKPASATQGTGILYVYEDSGYSILVEQDEHGFYEVAPGQTVYIQIENIEQSFDWVHVRISYEDLPGEATELGLFEVLDPSGLRYVGGSGQLIRWDVPEDAIPCYTYVVQYRNATADGPVKGSVYIASSPFVSRPAHLHVVPEYPIGTLGAISVLLASFGFYYLLKNRGPISRFRTQMR